MSQQEKPIRIVSPADHEPHEVCSICKKAFDKGNDDDEAITTLHFRLGEVTLCRSCYDKAGNDVR